MQILWKFQRKLAPLFLFCLWLRRTKLVSFFTLEDQWIIFVINAPTLVIINGWSVVSLLIYHMDKIPGRWGKICSTLAYFHWPNIYYSRWQVNSAIIANINLSYAKTNACIIILLTPIDCIQNCCSLCNINLYIILN